MKLGVLLVALALSTATCQSGSEPESSGSAQESTPAPEPAPQPTEDPVTSMTPQKATSFVAGPAISPSGALLEWLDNTVKSASPRRRVRLPFVVRFSDEHRLEFGDSFVGASAGDADADAIFVQFDDGGMSVPLLETLADLCPADADGCPVLLEGYWGELVDMPDFDMPDFDFPDDDAGPAKHPFAVLNVGGLVAAAPAHAEVEAPAP